MVVRLFADPPLPGTPASDWFRFVVGVCATVGSSDVETRELVLTWLGLDEVRRDSRVESVLLGGAA